MGLLVTITGKFSSGNSGREFRDALRIVFKTSFLMRAILGLPTHASTLEQVARRSQRRPWKCAYTGRALRVFWIPATPEADKPTQE